METKTDPLLVDEAFAKLLAEDLGTTWVVAFEIFGGESKFLANEWVTWIEEEERKYREKHGVQQTFKKFKAIPRLKRRAREEGKGAFRND